MTRRVKSKAKFSRLERRRAHGSRRPQRSRILIVTEDKKIAPDYFKLLAAKFEVFDQVTFVDKEVQSAPEKIVEYIENRIEIGDFDCVYCVFDKDTHHGYENAVRDIEKIDTRHKGKLVAAITSVPCFEFWFVLHMGYTTRGYGGKSPASEVCKHLEEFDLFKGYSSKKKSGKLEVSSFFEEIFMEHKNASKYAKKAISENAANTGAKEHFEDPSTRVYIVVENLDQISQRNYE